MFERPPDGFFVRDLIVFNHLRRGGYVSKGFIFQAPDVAFSQIVVGAVALPLMVLLALAKIRNREVKQRMHHER